MQFIISSLFLTLAVFSTFIGLSLQSDKSMGPPPPVPSRAMGPPPPVPPRVSSHGASSSRVSRPRSPMILPKPYYYNREGEIRAEGHPIARPVIVNDMFTGMIDGKNFFPIVKNGEVFIINLKEHSYIRISRNDQMQLRETAKEFMRRFELD